MDGFSREASVNLHLEGCRKEPVSVGADPGMYAPGWAERKGAPGLGASGWRPEGWVLRPGMRWGHPGGSSLWCRGRVLPRGSALRALLESPTVREILAVQVFSLVGSIPGMQEGPQDSVAPLPPLWHLVLSLEGIHTAASIHTHRGPLLGSLSCSLVGFLTLDHFYPRL